MESSPEQTAEGLAMCRVLATVLDRLVQANAPLAQADPGQVTRFHAMKAPGIGVQAYLERIHKYASCSNECFVLALIYIDRLIQRSNFLLTELNVHRVVITAVLLAAKFFDDAYYNNAYYAKVGGVLVSEMNGLEVDFLFRINFSLHVASDVFYKYRSELMLHSSVVNLVAMPTIAEHLSSSSSTTTTAQMVYSPQTLPVPTESASGRIQHYGGHQVTPSPPTPPDYAPPQQPPPSSYGRLPDYVPLRNPFMDTLPHHPTATIHSHVPPTVAYPSMEALGHDAYLPLDAMVSHYHQGLTVPPDGKHLTVATATPSYYPPNLMMVDPAYYVPHQPNPMLQHYHAGQPATPTSQDCPTPYCGNRGGSAWNYAMLGVSGAGM